MADKVKLAMVGCGGMSGAHMGGYKNLHQEGICDFELVATCDINRNAAETRANQSEEVQGFKPNIYEDVNEMLDKESEIEAVDICSFHSAHHDLACACLEAGKHVIIEKPLGITMKACRLIVETAKNKDRILAVAENYRRSPGQRAINWALKKGMIGKPRMLFYIDVGEALGPWGWRDHKNVAGAGWLLDGGVHYADMFRYHLGEAQEVTAVVKSFDPFRYRDGAEMKDPVLTTVEDSSFAVIKFENDAIVQWTSVRAAPGQGFGNHVIYGSEGSLDYGGRLNLRGKDESQNVNELFQESLSDDERERLFPKGITDSVATELKEFGDAVLGVEGVYPETDGMEGLKAMGICMGVLESAWFNKPVNLRDVENCLIEGYQKDLNEDLGLRDLSWNVWAKFG